MDFKDGQSRPFYMRKSIVRIVGLFSGVQKIMMLRLEKED